MADRIIRAAWTETVLESSGPSLNDGTCTEMTSALLSAATVGGLYTASFEFDVPTWIGTPTAGNVLKIVEQKINSDLALAPDPGAAYLYDVICAWNLPLVSAGSAKFRKEGVPINLIGGRYWVYWSDGGSGTVAIPATWTCRAILEDNQSEAV